MNKENAKVETKHNVLFVDVLNLITFYFDNCGNHVLNLEPSIQLKCIL